MDTTVLRTCFTSPKGRGRLDAPKRDSRVTGCKLRRVLVPLTLTLSPRGRGNLGVP